MECLRKCILLSLLAVFFPSAESARILAVVPSPSPSHHIWNRSIMLALARRGHHVTVLSPDIEKEKLANYKHILLEDSYSTNEEKFDFEEMAEGPSVNPLLSVRLVMEWGIECCKQQMQTKGAKELLSMPPDSFDLIIIETVFNDCSFMFLHHFGGGTRIPIIGVTAYGIGPWTDLLTGARTMPSVFTFPSLPFLSKMSFWERLVNTAANGFYWFCMYSYYHPAQQKIAEEAYGQSLPPLWKLASNISLLLVNNHYILNGPQPLLPGIIDVAGIQCSPSKQLPKDIQDFLDGSQKGAIYFSLGTNIRSEFLKKEKLKIMIDTFSALGPEIRVLWKFDPSTKIENLPSNILLKKWFPQEDVLGHPKILAFVSHGGLLSTQESIYHGVPIVGVPFFVDQHTNVRRLVDMGVGMRVDYKTLNKESFLSTILDVINTPRYKKNIQEVSRLFRDQPVPPLEKAMFWIEFALRHKEARIESLRFAGSDLNIFQYFLLDVLAVILLSFVIFILVVYYIMKFIYKKIVNLGKSKKTYKDSKKRK